MSIGGNTSFKTFNKCFVTSLHGLSVHLARSFCTITDHAGFSASSHKDNVSSIGKYKKIYHSAATDLTVIL